MGARMEATISTSSTIAATVAGVPSWRNAREARAGPLNSADTDSRVGKSVRDVREEVAQRDHDSADNNGSHHQRVIARVDRIGHHESHSRPGKHFLDEDSAAEQGGERQTRERDH